MNVWLDDFRRPGDVDGCGVWTGWGDWNVWVRDASTAIALVRRSCYANAEAVESISLDHDLGADGDMTGYDVACEIERLAVEGTLPRMYVYVHSANPVGAKRMCAAIEKAEEAWGRDEERPYTPVGALREIMKYKANTDPTDSDYVRGHGEGCNMMLRTVQDIAAEALGIKEKA